MKKYQPKPVEYYNNFKECLEGLEKKYKKKTAVTTYNRNGTPVVKSFEDIKNDSFLFAKALTVNELNSKNIAILSENCYEWLVAYFGIVCSGGVAVCIDTEHPEAIIYEMIKQSDCSAVVLSDSFSDLFNEFEYPLEKIIIGDPDTEEQVSFRDFKDSANKIESTALITELDPNRTCSIVYTSGTTSTAKAVMLSHKAILYNAADALTIISTNTMVFNTLPLYHSYGFTCGFLCPFLAGGNTALYSDLKRMMRDITLFKPNTVIAVPLIVESINKQVLSIIENSDMTKKIGALIKLNKAVRLGKGSLKKCMAEMFEGTGFENLELIVSGGAHLSPDVAYSLDDIGITVLQGYGITECSPIVSCGRNENYTLDSVGEILPGFQVKIEDEEIMVKGYSLMNGYYKNPDMTSEALEDGWFKTGDLGYINKGRLYITGRKKNIIVMKNGKKVSVEEMENEIKSIDLVKDAMVHGALSGSSTDDVKIAATIYPNKDMTAGMSSYEILEKLQDEIDEINKKLPTYQQIQMINIQEFDFNRTATQKIKRQII